MKRNWNTLCVAVVSPSGDLVYFEKQDNCQYASVSISQHKARTAARYRRPTLVFERLSGRGPYFAYLSTLDDVIMSRGGNPLVVGGKIIGAIGVSGGTGSQDDVVSLAGVEALK
jgi:glc operon protein GlcG